ncbi:hypothetical protein ABEB36_000114 [Hypothenemus hampei]|uniref:Uncharacterized protein n=1 Tax=Hypothenemus hampei TaxID=57062 RepID=A0ABD1FA99_HYPHA
MELHHSVVFISLSHLESTDAPTTPLSTESESDMQRFLEKDESKTPQTTHNALRNNDEDEYCVAGRRLSYQLKGLQDQQRFIAEKLISDVIFYARMKKLTETAVVHCSEQQSQQYESLQTPQRYTSDSQDSNITQYFRNYQILD